MKKNLIPFLLVISVLSCIPFISSAQPDLLLVQNSQTSVFGDEAIYYSFRVINRGPGIASNITFTDVIPLGLNFQGFVDLSVDVVASLPSLGSSGTISLSFPPIDVGAYREVFFKLKNNGLLLTGSTVVNSASISGPVPDPVPQNNVASVTTEIRPYMQDISVYKAAPAEIEAGGRIFYSLLIVNSNNEPAGFTLTDLLPAGSRFESLGTLPGSATVTTQPVGNQDLVKVVLPVSTAYHFTMTAIADIQVPANSLLINTAGISSTLPNQIMTNDESSAATRIKGACTFACLPDIVADASIGACGAKINFSLDEYPNSCGIVTAFPPPGSFFPVGNTQVQLSSGTGQRCSFMVSVKDIEPPVFTSCPASQTLCENQSGIYNIPNAVAMDNCGGAININYHITGATVRAGNGPNASGFFHRGVSVISWQATDAEGNVRMGCQTILNIALNPTISIPDVFALQNGVSANTVYLGYEPAAMIHLTAQTSATGPLTYSWSDGSHDASIMVKPAVTSNYVVNITGPSGCIGSATKTVAVVDIRCGNKQDKVQICKVPAGNGAQGNALCIATNAVAAQLSTGSYLGPCNLVTSATKNPITSGDEVNAQSLNLRIVSSHASPIIKFASGSSSGKPVRVSVYNSMGALVEALRLHSGSKEFALGSTYSPGWYFIVVSDGIERQTIRVLKPLH